MASLQTLVCLAWLWLVPAFQFHKNGGEVSVLVFGDSWGESGPSHTMLQVMFALHGVPAIVKNAAIGGTRACQWAARKNSMVDKTRALFPEKGPDFVWFTLGGNDLLDPPYLRCQMATSNLDDALDCLKAQTKKIINCSSVILDDFWSWYPDAKIVQCGYDLPCSEQECNPVPRFPFCKMNSSCAHFQFSAWQDMLLEPMKEKYAPRYTGINLMGTMQVLKNIPGASIGHPSIEQGSPCEMNWGCVHPIPGSTAASAIGDQFWKQFFSAHVSSTGKPYLWRPQEIRFPVQRIGDIEAIRTKCMWDWTPDASDADLNEFECDITDSFWW